MKSYFTLFAVVLIFVSCDAQKWRSISGEGPVVSQDLNIRGFTGVANSLHANITLTRGSDYQVTIEGQQNIIDIIKSNVAGGVLKFSTDKSIRNAKRLQIHITMPTLTYVSVSGSGKLQTSSKFDNLGDLDVKVSGSGDIRLNVEASDVNGRVSGSGDLYIKGSADQFQIGISGSGDIDAEYLSVSDLDAKISGSGSAVVNVTNSIDASISGSGTIRYRGNPDKVKSRVSGSGSVRSL